MNRQRLTAFMTALVLILPAGLSAQESEEPSAEDQIRQKERDLERSEPEGKVSFDRELSGKVLLNLEQALTARQDGVAGRDLGHLVSEGGRAYILRARAPSTIDVLRKNNGKTVSLVGRTEVEGKYFVVATVIEHQTAPPPMRRKRSGL